MNKPEWQKLVRQSLEETPRTEHFTDRLYELVYPRREFPEEAVRRLYLDRNILSHDGFMARFKRLWEGTEEVERIFPEELNGILHDLEMASAGRDLVTGDLLKANDIMMLVGSAYDRLTQWTVKFWGKQDKPKGGCPTCGGSGEVPCGLVHPNPNWRVGHDIPCPDCGGTGERRKGERREKSWRSHHRSGKERREGR